MECVKEFKRAKRYGRQLGLIIFDVDHFKGINDTYGHATGDNVLTGVSRLCLSKLRANDLMGRLGGEEFGVLLPETGAEAREVAEVFRQQIAGLELPHKSGPIRVSASFGVSELRADDLDADELMARVDAALYRAKSAGRNRVEWCGPKSGRTSQAGRPCGLEPARHMLPRT
jgi:diguanylate cyclase (GGDEF)-like protein